MISGFLLVNKDPGITSSRVVQILKKKFNLYKVGHLGTLDPMATGLLIIAINRATKFASLLLQSEKSYRAEVTLGIQTDTDDAEGESTSFKDVNINESEAEEALLTFLGESDQLPPNYSALKHKGKPMYKYARDGIKIEKAARKIGLKEKYNKKLIYQTLLGSVKLLLNENKSAEYLAGNIAVKGGTTEAALKILMKNKNFHKIISKAVKAAYNKANQLGK